MVMLNDLLTQHTQNGWALAMAPGFFRKYSYTGALCAFEDADLYKNLRSCGGASAGAIVSGFLACGQPPSVLKPKLFSLEREDFWDVAKDPTIIFGMLKGKKSLITLEERLTFETFEECIIPVGVTAYDIFRCKTRVITTGKLSTAVFASFCVPGMFQVKD
jgi:NTE family protein